MIVPYDISYSDRLIPLLRRFSNTSLCEYGLEMDDQRIRNLESILSDSTFLLLEGDRIVGVLGGIVTETMMSTKPVFQEVVWYVDEEHRSGGVRLLRHVENWCKDAGIEQIIMASMHNSMHVKLGRLYKKMGYRPMETHYIKTIS